MRAPRPAHDGAVGPVDAGDVTTEVNREDVRLVERGHHRRGRLGLIPRALRPDPERTLVARDRMARIDVKLPSPAARMDVPNWAESASSASRIRRSLAIGTFPWGLWFLSQLWDERRRATSLMSPQGFSRELVTSATTGCVQTD
jgi:hypothetical protein